MRTQQEAEAWAQQHGAVLKVNFAEGMASLQIGGFVAQSRSAAPLERALSELVEDLERQLGERLTQPDSIPGDFPGRSR
jgi:hypothetical protein